MSQKVRIILVIYGVAVALACVYVPVSFEGVSWRSSYLGSSGITDFKKNPKAAASVRYGDSSGLVSERAYAFVWNPTLSHGSTELPAYIDWPMVGVEIVVLTVLAGIAMMLDWAKIWSWLAGAAQTDIRSLGDAPTRPPTTTPGTDIDPKPYADSLDQLAPFLEPDVMRPKAIKAILLKFVKPRGLNLREVYEMAVEARPKEWNEKHPAPKWEELGIKEG